MQRLRKLAIISLVLFLLTGTGCGGLQGNPESGVSQQMGVEAEKISSELQPDQDEKEIIDAQEAGDAKGSGEAQEARDALDAKDDKQAEGQEESGKNQIDDSSEVSAAEPASDAAPASDTSSSLIPAEPAFSILNPEGMTLSERFYTPAGYERTSVEAGSFGEFVRNYPLQPDGAEVHLYDGRLKGIQSDHAAVFALPIENYDLQQCADSIIRMYGEYFYQTGQYDRMNFHFTSGFPAEYQKWREGYRISVLGNNVSWVQRTGADDSYESFISYMKIVFSYAGTLSMNAEASGIELADARIGDIFIHGGSPGHVVMIADVCENEEGRRAYLLAQGYMPAQEFHVLKNPAHDEDPWYYAEEIEYPFVTPEYVFEEGSLKRLAY